MKKAIYRFTSPARNFCTKAGQYLRNQRGDFYISDGVKIIIAVVLGALLLAALTTIFNDTVIPRISRYFKIPMEALLAKPLRTTRKEICT